MTFEEVYQKHRRGVYNLCAKFGSQDDAEDLMQEVFMQVYRKLHTFQGKSRFSTWLYRVTVNTVRMNRRRKRLPMMPLEKITAAYYDDPALKREIGRLDRAAKNLPYRLRQVWTLRDVLGYSIKETSALTGVTEGAVKSYLHRARTLLRRRISYVPLKPDSFVLLKPEYYAGEIETK